MMEKERGLDEELSIPWTTLIAPSTASELTAPLMPIVTEARMTTRPRKNFLFTESVILPATRPKTEYGTV